MREHDLIKTGDLDSCAAIEDGHGEVVLAYCRVCREGESGLAEKCPGPIAEEFPQLTEKERQETSAWLDEYDFDANCEEIAKKRGQVVVFPKPNQLQIDIDTEAQWKEFQRREEAFSCSVEPWGSMEITPSKSGLPSRHITITFPTSKTFTEWERIALQAALGSDPIREYLNALRNCCGIANPTRLFESPTTTTP